MSINTYKKIETSLCLALKEASALVKREFIVAQNSGIRYDQKQSTTGLPDFVTQTDKDSETIIRERLYANHDDIQFVGEETGGDVCEDGYFLVDPLDGTSNFMSLRGYFSICAAYVEHGDVMVAVVSNPMDDEMMSTVKGHGISLNGQYIKKTSDAYSSLNTTQLDCELTLTSQEDFKLVQKILPHTSGFRKSGSTALDLMHIAKGQRSVCIANHLKPYDIAAPLLIAREAGCVVSDINGKNATLESDSVIVASPKNHQAIMKIINT